MVNILYRELNSNQYIKHKHPNFFLNLGESLWLRRVTRLFSHLTLEKHTLIIVYVQTWEIWASYSGLSLHMRVQNRVTNDHVFKVKYSRGSHFFTMYLHVEAELTDDGNPSFLIKLEILIGIKMRSWCL